MDSESKLREMLARANDRQKAEVVLRLRKEVEEKRLRESRAFDSVAKSLPGSEMHWQEWVQRYYPSVCKYPFAARHTRLWEWGERLTPDGTPPPPRVECWARGGAKSSTAELLAVRACVRLSRRYILYVCGTQEQADKHVSTIGALMEAIGVQRALTVYGHSKGWRRQQLRTANGFNVEGIGLDVAIRGVKLDAYRPDAIILDDVDSQDDTPEKTEKKINALTTAIIPSGASNCAILFVQNKVLSTGVMGRLCDNVADFLLNRERVYIEPAVIDLKTELVDRGDGLKEYRIIGGEATWAGQSLEVCQQQINEMGLQAFLREAQHETEQGEGYMFDVSKIAYIDADEVPHDIKKVVTVDFAATEGAGDYTVMALYGSDRRGALYMLDMDRGQWHPDNVDRHLIAFATKHGCDRGVPLRLPQDPAAAGKTLAVIQSRMYPEFNPKFKPPTGSKATRAYEVARTMNAGNFYMVKADWNNSARSEFRLFREDEKHAHDDIVDTASDATDELFTKRQSTVTPWRSTRTPVG